VEFAPLYGRLTAIYHRLNYTACKPALAGIFLGAAALAAEYNGVEQREHIREKLAHLIAIATLVDASGVAASLQSWKTPSGTCVPGWVATNAGRWLAAVNAYKEYEIITDIAGGLGSCLPEEGDFFNPEMGPLLHKYISRKADVPPEHIHKLWRFIQDVTAGPSTGILQSGCLQGGGSPIMAAIGMIHEYDIEAQKNIVKRLCGIPIQKV